MDRPGKSHSRDARCCSFCGKDAHGMCDLVGGPSVFICDKCLGLCVDIIREVDKSSVSSRDEVPSQAPVLCCSFCTKSQRHVDKLIAGPAVFICDECVESWRETLQANGRAFAQRRRLLEWVRTWFARRPGSNSSYLVGVLR